MKLFKNCKVDPVCFFYLCLKTKEDDSDICKEELKNIVVIQNIFHLDNSFSLSKSLHFLFVRIAKRKRNFSFDECTHQKLNNTKQSEFFY